MFDRLTTITMCIMLLSAAAAFFPGFLGRNIIHFWFFLQFKALRWFFLSFIICFTIRGGLGFLPARQVLRVAFISDILEKLLDTVPSLGAGLIQLSFNLGCIVASLIYTNFFFVV